MIAVYSWAVMCCVFGVERGGSEAVFGVERGGSEAVFGVERGGSEAVYTVLISHSSTGLLGSEMCGVD